ncbi:hypothetical protein GAP86_18505 [Salmonella enterica]|nr:hypothetical protein [Salmonella enterica]EGN9441987.1 hypothetical protein [Salmonella enterica]
MANTLLGKSGKQLVYELLVKKNPGLTEKGITIDKLDFGTPAHIPANETPETQYTRLNTSLTVNGILAKKTFGKIDVIYRRLDLEHLLGDFVVSVAGVNATTVSEVLELFRTKYNLLVMDEDVIDPTAAPDTKDKTIIRMNGRSLVWTGQLEVYLTELPSDGKDIAKLINVTELDGLTYISSGIVPDA